MAEEFENDELIPDISDQEQANQKSGSKWKKWILMVSIPALVAYGVSMFILVPMMVNKAGAAQNGADSTVAEGQATVDSNYQNIGPIFSLEDIIVNPAGSNGERYVVLNLAMEMGQEKDGEEFKKREPIIRDIVIQILSSVPIDSLDGAENKVKLKEKISAELARVLPPSTLKRVYFTNFIIQ